MKHFPSVMSFMSAALNFAAVFVMATAAREAMRMIRAQAKPANVHPLHRVPDGDAS